jgi:hypothetical protein
VADADPVVRTTVADASTPAERAAASDRFLAQVGTGDPVIDATRTAGLVQLATSDDEKRRTLDALVARIHLVRPEAMGAGTTALTLLGPTDEHWRQIRDVLIGRMRAAPASVASSISGGLAGAPSEVLAEGRKVLLERIHDADPDVGASLAATLLALDPRAEDLAELVALGRSTGLVPIGEAVRAKCRSHAQWQSILHRLERPA